MTALAFWFVVLVVMVVLGCALALQWRASGAAVPVLLAAAAWSAVVFMLAERGALARFDALPPRIPLMALGAVGLGLVVSRLPRVRTALLDMPAWWPVALQTFRAPLELMLYLLFGAGLMPEQMTFSGSNFDVLVGLSAPVLAFLMARGKAPRWLQGAWQLLAVGLLVNVLRIAITSAPGPLHRDWPGDPLTVVAAWPYALLPGLLVPIAVLGHVAALARWFSREP